MEFESTNMSTIQLTIPTEKVFDTLLETPELPECTLELTETRSLCDEYFDTPNRALATARETLRFTSVGGHHFAIYHRLTRPGKLLAPQHERVARLNQSDYDAAKAGDRSHPVFGEVGQAHLGALIVQLTRRSVFLSRLYRIDDTRFELGIETVTYESGGSKATERLVNLELIEGHQAVLDAIEAYLKIEYQLELVVDRPLVRGQRLIEAGLGLPRQA